MPAPQRSEGPVTPPVNQGASSRTNLKRRGFLLALGVTSAGAAALAARSLTGTANKEHAERDVPVSGDDGISEHAARYYKTARV